ncbi:hypothetical protein ATANTOWER_027369 [Ataeniobius toweri]|uniref:Secreted protein n=1 Tax=Ataeniobius toweri TaxID=208326 RepID=A0ABU7AKT7_9TELE|nr:hypothetical protein [Ataeniobius toweri]
MIFSCVAAPASDTQQVELSIFMSLGGSWSTQREPTHAQGEHANSNEKNPRLAVEPKTFLLQGNSATNCVTVQPYN